MENNKEEKNINGSGILVDIALLKKDVEIINNTQNKLETTLNKFIEVLEKEKERHADFVSLLNVLTTKVTNINDNLKTLEGSVRDNKNELTNIRAGMKKFQDDIELFRRWKYGVLGGMFVITAIFTFISNILIPIL